MAEPVVAHLSDKASKGLPEAPGIGLFRVDGEQVEWFHFQGVSERKEGAKRRIFQPTFDAAQVIETEPRPFGYLILGESPSPP